MRHRSLAIALTAVVALLPALTLPALGAEGDPPPAAPKVVIVVGATESTTASYRRDADSIAAEALKYTPNVVKLYSPNATWAKVKAAAQGASIFVYLGHGYGFPSPYRPVLSPDVHNGMGLNAVGGIDDWDKKYYGEDPISKEIRFAKDAIVLLNHLCYSAGSSESHHAEPTMSVARQRVDNYASGFIKAGARTVIAQSWTSGVIYTIRSIFTTDQTILDAWEVAPNQQGHEQPFVPVRNPQFEARVDPDTWTTGFHRAIVSATSHTTTQVRQGAGVPGTTATATADAGPELWSMDGPTDLTPNFDGVTDTLNLLGRFSENATWTARIKDADGETVRTQTGSGHQAAITWDVKVGGQPAPDGDYSWHLSATDAAGGTGEWSGPLAVSHPEVPSTGVLAFKPTTPTTTTSSTVVYSLVFASPVTGLVKSDFTRTGNSTGCVQGPPVLAGDLSGAEYTITLTECSTGWVGFYLNADQVTDAALVAGPAGPISAAKVTIDRTAPKVSNVKPELTTGVQMPGTTAKYPLPAKLTWTGTDKGAGIASYDVQRSYDGGSWTTIASKTTAKWLDVSLNPGHRYRFRVRARDKAGNLGAWVTTSTWYPKLIQQSSTTVKAAGAWTYAANSAHSGGSVKFSATAGSSVSHTFSGRAVAWVTTLRPGAGEVQVYVDGVLAATIDTGADSVAYRQVVFSRTWTSYGSHTIKLVVVGTPDRPRAELDAFEVIG